MIVWRGSVIFLLDRFVKLIYKSISSLIFKIVILYVVLSRFCDGVIFVFGFLGVYFFSGRRWLYRV